LALPFVLSLGLGNSLSHDEHQHISAGVLFARDGLIPYRDFAYFHVPYLVYAYGLLFKFTDHYVLCSRLFSVGCAALTCGAIFATSWSLFNARPGWQRLLISIGAVCLLLSSPVASETIGHSWNHEPSVLLVLLAFLCQHAATRAVQSRGLLFVGGLLTGLAVGTRVTLAPVVVPFAAMIWLGPSAEKARLRGLITFAAGIALALIPVACAFFHAPEGFIFGNVEFPKLNIEYRFATGEPRTMTVLKKLRFFFKLVMRPNWLLFYGFVAAWIAAFTWKRPFRDWPRMFCSVLFTLPFLLLGALAPSPVFDQYFYALAPFLVLGMLCILAETPADSLRLRWMWVAAAAAVVCSMCMGAGEYDGLDDLIRPGKWAPSKFHGEAHALREAVSAGKVLTLAPTLPLEAGLQIYPEFVTGPFGWRIAPFVAPARRRDLRIAGPEDLDACMIPDPPVGILLGFDKRWELPLARHAAIHDYRHTSFAEEKHLWITPPSAVLRRGSR